MHLKSIELSGFKSFAKKSALEFSSPIAGIVGPNGSGKSNTAEAFRFVLGEQSMKSMRGKRGPDLIWTGNDKTPRANRARVAVAFDNTQKLLDIDFDEVVVERIVHRDGVNEYAINGSKVRLKDIAELLASANIGASGHHIISQGEADRILGASEKDRREMIEEALGLKAYHYKKTESEKKLEKTTENMKEVKMLRRELAPHLTFLEKQMEKLERSRELAGQLNEALVRYVRGERAYIEEETARLTAAEVQPKEAIVRIDTAIAAIHETHTTDTTPSAELTALDARAGRLRDERSELERHRGRLEGQIAFVRDQHTHTDGVAVESVPFSRVETLLSDIARDIEHAQMHKDVSALSGILGRIKTFISDTKGASAQAEKVAPQALETLEHELVQVNESLSALESEESALGLERENLLASMQDAQQHEREAQKRYFELKDERRTAERALEDLQREAQHLMRITERLSAVEYDMKEAVPPGRAEHAPTRAAQEDAYRDIERMQARLEEAGFVDDDTVREFEETKERDAFLAREVDDLEQSKKTLLEVLDTLEGELATRFESGLDKINDEFKKFFAMLFDGGDAKLSLVAKKKKGEDGEVFDDEDVKPGIEINVQLPRKKVATLDVLSGGERALTSIALIFAMSQVNPPPFIILDETDAALDEANSRKYADMVRALSEKSQLILITHNRQTMEAAGELYGVTMGNDGVSKLLSVKFDDAVSVAK